MYEIGSYIVKNVNGVCKVEDIVEMDVMSTGQEKKYYLLIPTEDKTGKVYVPVEGAEKCTREIMTEEEVYSLINNIPKIDEIWIDNEKQREIRYKEALRSRNPEMLVGIIKMIYLRNSNRMKQGKKNTVTDERYFKLAEEYLYSEIAIVLNRDKKEVPLLIKNIINS